MALPSFPNLLLTDIDQPASSGNYPPEQSDTQARENEINNSQYPERSAPVILVGRNPRHDHSPQIPQWISGAEACRCAVLALGGLPIGCAECRTAGGRRRQRIDPECLRRRSCRLRCWQNPAIKTDSVKPAMAVMNSLFRPSMSASLLNVGRNAPLVSLVIISIMGGYIVTGGSSEASGRVYIRITSIDPGYLPLVQVHIQVSPIDTVIPIILPRKKEAWPIAIVAVNTNRHSWTVLRKQAARPA